MKKVIIVGASSGIGKELTRLFARCNYKVGIIGRREKLLKEIVKEFPERVIYQNFDITKGRNEVVLEELKSKLGGLDLLIFCVGCEARNPDNKLRIEQKSVLTNIVGFVEVVNWAIRFFIKKQSGHLISISSIAGLRGGRIAPSYNASKAFQINYFEGLRQMICNKGVPVYVTDIRPGFVDTDLANKEHMFWEISAEKAAQLIYQSINSKSEVAYIPIRWKIFVPIIKILPGFIYNML